MTLDEIKYAYTHTHAKNQTKDYFEYWYKVCKAKENDVRLSDSNFEMVRSFKSYCKAMLEHNFDVVINEPLPKYREWKQERPFVYVCEGWQIRNTVQGWKVLKPNKQIYGRDFHSFYTAKMFAEKKMEELGI